MISNEIIKQCQLIIDKVNIKEIKLQEINKLQNESIKLYYKMTKKKKKLQEMN